MLFSATNLIAILILGSVVIAAAQDQPGTVALRPDQSSSAATLQSPSNSIQDTTDPEYLPPGTDPQNRLLLPFGKHIIGDQARFWQSPKELKQPAVLKTFLPFTAFTGALIAGDSWFAKQLPNSPSQIKRSKSLSNYAVFSLVGAAGGAYVFGNLTHNDHLSEAGFLSGEAALNSTLITYAFKEVARRQRPYQGNGNGTFFQGGSSFPSEHSAVAWSVASVIAHEYPGPLTQIGAYGLASAVSLTRVTGKQHFPADVVIGSALGWYLGRQVYRAHHDPELGGAAWGELVETNPEAPRNPANMGSTAVPLDSWVYPAIERLAALGYIKSAYLGMRPWTRMECARLLEEANENLPQNDVEESGEAGKLYTALSEEFVDETSRLNGSANLGISLDSIYTRVTGISGTPLRDGYHFGQTITNDYGRPYGEGFNNVTGFTSHAVAGPFSFNVRGEYQHAPAVPSYSMPVQQAIANADFTAPVPNAAARLNRFNLLEASVAFTFHNTQISFGRQSIWLGSGESGSLLFSNNAESVVMLKLESTSPYEIPLLSRVLGRVKSEFFLGQLAGQQFELDGDTLLGPGGIDPQPYLSGYKASFHPTDNLQFGMGITAQFAGPGLPFTWHNFLRTFYVHNQSGPTAANANPGKRISEADLSYRVPGLRNWLTVYMDTLVVDEVSPIGSTRPTLNPGIYMPRIPKLPKLEFRAEGIKEPLTNEFAPGFVYYGLRRYRSGYTNEGMLMGAWIGRAGRGGQGWITYSLSPQTRLQASYRHQAVSNDFLEGGRAVDYSVRSDFMVSKQIGVSAFAQYERWSFPLLAPVPKSNLTAAIQVTLYPHLHLRK